jgi:hypothetical protein
MSVKWSASSCRWGSHVCNSSVRMRCADQIMSSSGCEPRRRGAPELFKCPCSEAQVHHHCESAKERFACHARSASFSGKHSAGEQQTVRDVHMSARALA